MRFDDILSNCIDAMNRGETIESCLARYPEHAAELSSLLQLVASMPKRTQLRLSPQAFAQGRTLLMSAAHAAQHRQASSTHSAGSAYRQSHHDNHSSKSIHPYHTLLAGRQLGKRPHPFHPNGRTAFSDNGDLKNDEGNYSPHLAPASFQTERQTQPALFRFRKNQWQRDATSANTARSEDRTQLPHWRIQTLLTALVMLLIVASSVVVYQATMSLPSSTLYDLKTLGRQAQGFLMLAADDGATWHAEQMLVVLDEFSLLEQQNLSTPDLQEQAATTVALARYHAQQALLAGPSLPQNEQVAFYSTWLIQLEAEVAEFDANYTHDERISTLLQDTIAQVNQSLIALTETPTVESATPTPSLKPEMTDTVVPENRSIILIGTNTPAAPMATTAVMDAASLRLIAIESAATPVLLATERPLNTLSVSPAEVQTLVPLATVMPTSVQIFRQSMPKEVMTIGQEDQSNEERSSDETSPTKEPRETGEQHEAGDNNDSLEEEAPAEATGSDGAVDDTNDATSTAPSLGNGTIPQVGHESASEPAPSVEETPQITATPSPVDPSTVIPEETPVVPTPLLQQQETLTPSATDLVSTPDVNTEPEESTVVETPEPTAILLDPPQNLPSTRVAVEPTAATEDGASVTPEPTAEEDRSERQSARQSQRRRRPSQAKIIDESTPSPATPEPQTTSQLAATSPVNIDSDESGEP